MSNRTNWLFENNLSILTAFWMIHYYKIALNFKKVGDLCFKAVVSNRGCMDPQGSTE